MSSSITIIFSSDLGLPDGAVGVQSHWQKSGWQIPDEVIKPDNARTQRQGCGCGLLVNG